MLDEATSFLQVDVTILTTGQSSSGRKRRQEVFSYYSLMFHMYACIFPFAQLSLRRQVAAGLKALLRKKTKVGSINIDTLLKVRIHLSKFVWVVDN